MSQLYGIQVLRALAALMVAVHHVQSDAVFLAERAGAQFSPWHLLPWTAGVDLFFVISGFIMVHSSAGLFGKRDGARLFLARRFARIVPLYWATTTLFLLVLAASPALVNSGAASFAQIAASYLFWPFPNAVGALQPVYSLGWTLNYEMLFYALFGAALLLPRALVVPAVTLALAGLVVAEAAGPLPLPFGFWGQPIVLEFAGGMAVALLRNRGLRLDGRLRWLMVAAGAALLIAAVGHAWAETPWGSLAFRGPAALLLVTAAACGKGQSAPSALVRLLARLGDASYALYLVHPFAMRAMRELFSRLAPGATGLFVILALIAAIAAALAVYRWFERPMTKTLRRVLRA
ncbi:acyltransferase family protein [Bosea sp. (in: a-proteobacteria)]|uniref:acyltransferase family protein n=1 Tax=Bosea sp. (in: a-proteobacteria) TaxID=1871050 RepID=UPI002FC70455